VLASARHVCRTPRKFTGGVATGSAGLSDTAVQLLDRIQSHATGRPGKEAYADGDSTLTYQRLAERIAAIAERVRTTVGPDDVVMVRLPNGLDFAPAVLGVLAAGRAVLPVSPESPSAELDAVFGRAGVVAVIGPESVASLAMIDLNAKYGRDIAPSPGTPGEGGGEGDFERPTVPGGRNHHHPNPLPDYRERGPDGQPVSLMRLDHPGRLLLLSSGSTGRPKIVSRSAASLDAVCRQMVEAIGVTPDDRFLATVPLCHSYGIEHGLLAPLWAGAETRLVRGLELGRVQSELTTGGITLLPGVPSTFEMLSTHATGQRFPSLRAAYSAGGYLPPVVAAAFSARCGTPVGQIYGATEIGSVSYTPINDGTVGRPMNGVDVRIGDGRVLVRAGSMFDGYLDDPSPVQDGYYPTGDLGRLDDTGRLVVTGRATLLIDVGGLKVDPLEVERVIATHPRVADCVVVPVRQSETVVRLKAVITARDPAHPPAADELRTFARDRLSAHKIPRVFEIRAELPRSVTGKILRHLVQA
jgi:acyl-coenzyme A synthetase/AMP-(fatty) acid ligase